MTVDSRTTAFLKDARECEEDADAQLRTMSQADQGIRDAVPAVLHAPDRAAPVAYRRLRESSAEPPRCRRSCSPGV